MLMFFILSVENITFSEWSIKFEKAAINPGSPILASFDQLLAEHSDKLNHLKVDASKIDKGAQACIVKITEFTH